MVVQAGQILSAARFNAQFAAFQSAIDIKTTGFAKAKSSDTSRTNNTYSDDPHLTFQGVANQTYNVFIRGVYFAPVTPAIKFQFVFPSGNWTGGAWEYDPGTDNWVPNPLTGSTPLTSPAALQGLTGHATDNFPFRFEGRLALGATGGTCALQWAQNVTNASATILRIGSWLTAMQVN